MRLLFVFLNGSRRYFDKLCQKHAFPLKGCHRLPKLIRAYLQPPYNLVNYELRITNYELRITNYELRIINH